MGCTIWRGLCSSAAKSMSGVTGQAAPLWCLRATRAHRQGERLDDSDKIEARATPAMWLYAETACKGTRTKDRRQDCFGDAYRCP